MFYKSVGKRCTNENCVKYKKVIAPHRTTCDELECGRELEVVRIANKPVIMVFVLVCLSILVFFAIKSHSKNLPQQPTDKVLNKDVQPEVAVRDKLKDFVTKANDPNIVLMGDNKLVIKDKVFFAFDSYNIEPAGEDILKKLAVVFRQLLDDEDIREKIESVGIQGHTDNKGSDNYNKMLSQNRAEAVLQYIVKAEPLLNTKYINYLKATGYGSNNPEKDNATDEGRAYNRRMSVVVNINR